MQQSHATVTSIQIGKAKQYSGDVDGDWTSAIQKTPVDNTVLVTEFGIDGDEQVDRVHHGGRDKAVLCYCGQHYAKWRETFPDVDFGPGGFGENLTVSDIDEKTCCVGDTFRIGECVLEVSQPRQPCWKLSRRWALPTLAVDVQHNGRSGWYCRVLQPGNVRAGDLMTLVERPYPDVTIEAANRIMYSLPKSAVHDLELAACPALSESWHTTLTKRATRG